MKLQSAAVAMLCLAGLFPAVGFAQKAKDKPKPVNPPKPAAPAKDQPKVAVVANVQVNVATQINIGGASQPAQPPQRKSDGVQDTSPSDLMPALGQASQHGAGVVVVANVKIDVSTAVNVLPSTTAAAAAREAPSGRKETSAKPKGATAKEKGTPAKPAAETAGTTSPASGTSGGPKTASGQPRDPSREPSGDDLFELHVRLRRTASGVDVLLAGTAPTPQGAATAAERINLVKEQGMLGLLVLPLILKIDPEMHRAFRAAWSSIKADASGTRLALTASVPHEAIAAAAKLAEAARQFANDLLGRK